MCMYTCAVPLSYNFIFTRVEMRVATQYFTCQMPKFPPVFCIFTRRDMALPQVVFTGDVAFICNGIVTFPHHMVVLKNWQVSSCL